MTSHLAAIAGAFAALYAAHQVADHWTQTDWQATNKGRPGRVGSLACQLHVATYTLTAVAALAALGWASGVWFNGWGMPAGLAVSAVTHYIADRRTPLRRMAEWTGHGGFFAMGKRPQGDPDQCLGTGAYALDQSWHVGWLFVSALIIGRFG